MQKENNKKAIEYAFYFGASAELLKRAKQLRRNLTTTERLLWDVLKDKSKFPIRWRRQHPAHKFILDFYCPFLKLAVEIDGDSHLSDLAKFYDQDRDQIMLDFGVTTLRFTNDDILNRIDEVENKIRIEIEKRSGQ